MERVLEVKIMKMFFKDDPKDQENLDIGKRPLFTICFLPKWEPETGMAITSLRGPH